MDKKTRRKVKAVIHSQNLSAYEIEDAIRRAEMFEEQDRKLKEKLDAVNRAQTTIHSAKRLVVELTEQSDKDVIEGQIKELTCIIEDEKSDAATINNLSDRLLELMNSAYSSVSDDEPITDIDGFRRNTQESQDFYNNF